MNSKAKSFIKNFSYTFLANAVSFLISAVLVFFVPKRLGVEQYGYWQLYTLYTSYVGFFHLGWCDGVYLRYGGQDYHELEKPVFVTQFWMLTAFEFFITAGLGVYGFCIAPEAEKGFILAMMGVCALLQIPRTYLSFVLQFTNRIKEYAAIVMLERVIYFVLVTAAVLGGVQDYRLLLAADLIGKAAALAVAVCRCRDIVFGRLVPLRAGLSEAGKNINVGFKLMIANIASLLIVGIVRMTIENKWGVATFGKVSLTMSVSNLLMVFIGAVSIILFPTLRRTSDDKLAGMYDFMRTSIMTVLLGLLIFYYPAKLLLTAWLPKYAEALTYMALMFPVCVFESKTSMLVNTYMKILRREKWILLINACTVALSILISGLTVFLLENLTLAVLSIVVLQTFRCIFGELLLSRDLDIRVRKDIVLEVLMTATFIATAWFLRSWLCTILYGAAYLVYVLIKRQDIARMLGQVKSLIKR